MITSYSVTGVITIVIVNVYGYTCVVTSCNITLFRVALAYVCTMLVAYCYVTGIITVMGENVFCVSDKITSLNVTGVVARQTVNVCGLSNVSALLYVTIGVACIVEYVVAFPNSNQGDICGNGIFGKVPRSSVKERPSNEYISVSCGSSGFLDKISLAGDDGLYHISACGVKFNGQGILSFAARRKSKYRQSNTQCKYCDFGGESNIFHTSS